MLLLGVAPAAATQKCPANALLAGLLIYVDVERDTHALTDVGMRAALHAVIAATEDANDDCLKAATLKAMTLIDRSATSRRAEALCVAAAGQIPEAAGEAWKATPLVRERTRSAFR